MTIKDDKDEQQLLVLEKEKPSKLPVPTKVLRLMRKHMPRWTSVLEEQGLDSVQSCYHTVDGKSMTMNEGHCCMVGEMYGFTGDYADEGNCDCDICTREKEVPYCAECTHHADNVVNSDPKIFYPAIEKAVLHFDAVHGMR